MKYIYPRIFKISGRIINCPMSFPPCLNLLFVFFFFFSPRPRADHGTFERGADFTKQVFFPQLESVETTSKLVHLVVGPARVCSRWWTKKKNIKNAFF